MIIYHILFNINHWLSVDGDVHHKLVNKCWIKIAHVKFESWCIQKNFWWMLLICWEYFLGQKWLWVILGVHSIHLDTLSACNIWYLVSAITFRQTSFCRTRFKCRNKIKLVRFRKNWNTQWHSKNVFATTTQK